VRPETRQKFIVENHDCVYNCNDGQFIRSPWRVGFPARFGIRRKMTVISDHAKRFPERMGCSVPFFFVELILSGSSYQEPVFIPCYRAEILDVLLGCRAFVFTTLLIFYLFGQLLKGKDCRFIGDSVNEYEKKEAQDTGRLSGSRSGERQRT